MDDFFKRNVHIPKFQRLGVQVVLLTQGMYTRIYEDLNNQKHGDIMRKITTKLPGWWCNFTILKNDEVKVNVKDDYPINMKWKIIKKMFETTNQLL